MLSSACQSLTDDVWQVIFGYLTAKELLLCLARVCRRLFQLTVGDTALATHLWRELWLTHLAARGGSQGSGGLGTLIQSVALHHAQPQREAPSSFSLFLGEGGVESARADPGKWNEVNFIMDDGLVSTLSSPLLFSVAPLQLSYAPATVSQRALAGGGSGPLTTAAAPAGLMVAPRPPSSPLLGSQWNQWQHRVNQLQQSAAAATNGAPSSVARTSAFLRLLGEDIIASEAPATSTSLPRGATAAAASDDDTVSRGDPCRQGIGGGAADQKRALAYAKALTFLLPRSRPRCLLEGPLVSTVHLNIFHASTNSGRDGTGEESFQKGIELKNALQRSWEAMYSAQLLSSAPALCADTPTPSTTNGAAAAGAPAAAARDGKLPRDFKTGNALFDYNVLLTRAAKRTDVYQAIVTGVKTDIPPGLGLIFPICASQEALAEWRSSVRHDEAARHHASEADSSSPHQSPCHPPPRSLRLIAEEEERVVMADGGWAASRRYVMSPFYNEDGSDSDDDSSEGDESGRRAGDVSAATTHGDGRNGDETGVRPPRLSSAQKATLRAERLARRNARFRAEEDALLNQGAVLGSVCVNAKPDMLPEADACLVGGQPFAEANGHHQDESSSTSLAIETDPDGSVYTSSMSIHTDASSDAGVGDATEPLPGNGAGHHAPVDHFTEVAPPVAHGRREGDGSQRVQRTPPPLPVLSDSVLNGILAPGALALRTPTNHQIPFVPTLAPAVPLLFSAKHIATYLYLLQHVTFSDVRHHIWEPHEVKCALCAHLVSPTGDCVETRFFFSHLGGSYPRVYMKMSFIPGDPPRTLFRERKKHPANEAPASSSSSSCSSERGGGVCDADNHGTGADQEPVVAVAGMATLPPLAPTAFPPSYAAAAAAAHTTAARKSRATGDSKGRRREEEGKQRGHATAAHARWRHSNGGSYRHQHILDFDTLVDVFCGGFGRVEVDIPPSVSRQGLEVLRAVLGLGEDFPISLLWNVVVYATGLGPQMWETHLSTFLYHYKMTFTDAVERAFGLRECYGPLNGLRPREFPDPLPPPPRAPAAPLTTPAAAGRSMATLLPPAQPVTVTPRTHIAPNSGTDHSSSSSSAATTTTTSDRATNSNDANTDEYSSSNFLDEHERAGDFSDGDENPPPPANPFSAIPPPVPGGIVGDDDHHSPDNHSRGEPTRAGASHNSGTNNNSTATRPPPQQQQQWRRPRDSDSDSSSEPANWAEGDGMPDGGNRDGTNADEEDLYSDVSVDEAWREAYY